jgi:lipoprotein-releasing system permease protein
MYKALLCWRYLRTRYLAFACIVSVMLGVATLIVVNSVMSGFSEKLRDNLHALMADIVIESRGLDGFFDPKGKMDLIRKDPFLSERIEAMNETLETFAMMQFRFPNGEHYTRPVKLIGVRPEARAEIGGFKEYLTQEANRENPTFELPAKMKEHFLEIEKQAIARAPAPELPANPELPPPPKAPEENIKIPQGCFVGNLIASFRKKDEKGEAKDHYVMAPGDSIILTTISGAKLTPVYDRFVVVDYFKSGLSEYDGNYIFVSLDYLQQLRTMPNRVTAIQIKLKSYEAEDAKKVVDRIEKLFPFENLKIATWEEKQGPLLAAIRIEKGILNVLLFMIVAVAGFGILAIFSMIVAEKTRDIGILKSLGASNLGVLQIFLGYGLLLGVVGAGLGSALGIWITININTVEKFIAGITGMSVFDPSVYYFKEIPTCIHSSMVAMVNAGAIGIAVLFSVMPALRAASLHPVRALRYE